MQAIGLSEYGGPEVLHPVELAEPHAGGGEVRVAVRAAAVNPADVMLRDGSLAALYAEADPPFIPGMDIAGTLDEIGPDVDAAALGLEPGADVVGIVDNFGSVGGYSEYVVLPAASVTRAPAGVDVTAAASFLMNALTARTTLDTLALEPGSTLLVTGAAGAYGGYVTQLASAEGLRVVAVAGEADEETVRGFGADVFVVRGEDIARRVVDAAGGPVDAVADGALLRDGIADAVRDGGRMADVRGWDGPVERGITVHPINVRSRATDHEAIERLRRQVEDGALALRVAEVLPASQTAEAHHLLDKGGLRGRIILTFGDGRS
ncbi:MAG: NADP-dependent oxidoreductase [Actinomycetota bacterium]|nr:NADP-dependent oxidoreductase [Actinomycetota bacterium]